MMHLDMAPFAPLTNANPLLGTMSVPAIYVFCIVTGVAGALAGYVPELRLLGRAVRAFVAGRTGDAAAFKAAAAGARAHPGIAARLRALDDPLPRIDLDRLRSLPDGTFGRAYAAFMDANGLRPFAVSASVAEELAATHLLAVRYPMLHDAFHVLLDFDTTLAGELGVWSFVGAQRYGAAYERAALSGAVLYPLVVPWRLRELRAHRLRGRRLAATAACVIAEPLERWWAEPLDLVRARLGIDLHAR
jgi:hypothetical protein